MAVATPVGPHRRRQACVRGKTPGGLGCRGRRFDSAGRYISSQRLNLGLFQQDINVLWDLAPHDLAVILYLLGQRPESVNAVGTAHINLAIEDVAVMTLRFAGKVVAMVSMRLHWTVTADTPIPHLGNLVGSTSTRF